MGKINKVVSYQNLTPDLLEALQKKYPDGYQNHVMKVQTNGDNHFFAVTLDVAEFSYLIKVPVKIDAHPEEIDEKDYSGGEDDFSSGPGADDYAEDSSEEDVENIPDNED